MDRIFISYRRKDSIGIARLVYEKLIDHFGDGTVFMDIDVIPPGTNFREHINGSMERAKIVLALIGDGWGHVQGNGHSRLHDPTDFVRIELELALERSIPIIPVLIGQTSMPTEGELPASIGKFAYYNATMLDPGRDFRDHTKRLIQDVERHLRPGGFKIVLSVPKENTVELLSQYYREADAYITVSPEHSLVVEKNTELIGFRNLMNAFRSVEIADGKARPLIWVLDLGREQFDDLDSRMRFLNVQKLMTRFKALKRFEEDGAEERWEWLVSRAIIAVLDTRGSICHPTPVKRPTFTAHHVSLTTIEPTWLESEQFRELYGMHFEKQRQRAFTIVFNARSEWASFSERTSDLKFVGYVSYPTNKLNTHYHVKALELPQPPTNYEEAFRTICVAAAHSLGINYAFSKPQLLNGVDAIQQLGYLGYNILNLREFLELY